MYVGILPGLGASIVDWVAYGHAVQSAPDRENFGKGDVRGVIAPESANNAMKGASLIPTVAFGIPGSATMAILLGAFLIQGITPGPSMLTDKLHITFSMMWTVVIANIICAGLLMIWSKQLAKVTFIRSELIIPAIILFVFMGAWMSGSVMGDWYLFLILGLLGLVMRYAGWPRAPVVLGFVLGSIMETALHITLQKYSWDWILRPISGIICALAILTVVLSASGFIKRRRDAQNVPAGEGAATGREAELQKFTSLPFAIFMLAIFSFAIFSAKGWPEEAGLLLDAFCYPGAAFCLIILINDIREFAKSEGRETTGPILAQYASVIRNSKEPLGILGMYGWFVGIIIVTYIAGQMISLPLFVFAYMKIWRKESWKLTLIYTFLSWLLLWGMFGEIIHVVWQPPLLEFLPQ
jgi:putative tricarboxylic transport membrane protein